MYTVQIKNLTKTFDKTKAIDDLSLNIEKGKITGVIGADGAGKTTLIRLIIGLLSPDSGEVSVLGINPYKDKLKLVKKIGYMPQKFGLYEDLTVIENLKLYADLKGVNGKGILKRVQNDKAEGTQVTTGHLGFILGFKNRVQNDEINNPQIDKMLEFTKLKPFQKRFAGDLSGGMKQKLGLACTLLATPKFLILDEPSVGVDPISRRDLMQMVKEMISKDTTVLWSTAYLDEAYSFDCAVVLDNGKVIFNGAPHTLSQNPQEFEKKVIELMGGYEPSPSLIAKNYTPISFEVDCAVQADNLEKKYGSFYAVKNNSFCIQRGEIFGLLGPNGAGKSTSFKMMCGLSRPTKGTARIMGVDILKDPSKARSSLGYMAQKFSLYGALTLRQNLEFFAAVYGIDIFDRKRRIDEIVEVFEFQQVETQKASELPLGFKQRLSLACALIHNPPILFLDEPTSGVDIIARKEFWNHIISLSKKGVTILVTTHFMDEAEYCDRISLFYKGETVAIGTPKELKAQAHADNMEDTFINLIKESQK